MHYYKFNVGDWRLHTSHLTLEEDAVYRRLVDFYYDTEKPIPLDIQTVIRRLCLASYVNIVKTILNEFFIETSEGWRNSRCDKEISDYHALAEKNRVNGKAGGRPKSAKNEHKNNPVGCQSVTSRLPVVSESEPTGNPNYKPITINHKTTPPLTPPRSDPPCGPELEIQNWQPDQQVLRAKLVLYGIRCPTWERVLQLLAQWRDHNAHKAMTDNQKYQSFGNWIRRSGNEPSGHPTATAKPIGAPARVRAAYAAKAAAKSASGSLDGEILGADVGHLRNPMDF